MGKKRGKGQPSKYTTALSNEICERLSQGETLISICKSEHIPCYATIMNWLWYESDYKADFLERYMRARDMQADFYADEITEIADDAQYDWVQRQTRKGTFVVMDREHVQRSQLRVDARKWIAAKLKPKKYSEKFFQEIDTNMKQDIEVIITHGDGEQLGNTSALPRLDSIPKTNSQIKEKT